MNELIPDKQTYQTNKRRIAWSALGMMIISTIAVLINPARMAEADAVLIIDVWITIGTCRCLFWLFWCGWEKVSSDYALR